jgi:magnesium transporter
MLVNCAAYRHGRKVADVPVNEIHTYVPQDDCFVWVALKDPEPDELDAMQVEFGLHDLAVEDARHGHQRPKLEEYGNTLFAVLHTIEPLENELEVGEIAIFVGPNFVLSVRRNARRGFAEVRTRCENEPALLQCGSAYVLYALMDAVVDRYFPILDALDSEIETIEERIFGEQNTRANVEAVYAVKRKLLTLKHAVSPQMESISKLFGGRVPQSCMGLEDYFRDVYDHLVRMNQSIDSLRDTLTTAISVNLSLVAMQSNEVGKRLAAYAALVAVPTMVAGVYGMNFSNMPELHWVYGYPLVLGIMVVLDCYLFYRFRKAQWL